MRKTSISHWTNLKDLDCLLFFAQSIDEMLYDFTLDSYKPLALNSRLLCIEVLNTIDEVKGEFMPKKNLQSILEELKWSLEKDYAAKQLFGKKFDYYLREIKPSAIRLNELETTIKHIYGFFEDRKYLDQIKKSIKELIIENKEKVKLKRLTNSFVTELINYGYNPNHIDFHINGLISIITSNFENLKLVIFKNFDGTSEKENQLLPNSVLHISPFINSKVLFDLLKELHQFGNSKGKIANQKSSQLFCQVEDGKKIKKQDLFTNREVEVLELVSEGKTSKSIANILNISIRTVEFYRRSMLSKSDCKTQAHLVKFALRNRIIQ